MSVSETENKKKGGMIVLLIFLLVCAGLGIAAFAMAMTKCKKDGFSCSGRDNGGRFGGQGELKTPIFSHGETGGEGRPDREEEEGFSSCGGVSGGGHGEVHRDGIHIFHAPWCGYCKTAMPEFIKLKDDLKDIVKLIDATTENGKALAAKFDVKGYPTIKLLKDGKASDHTGERTHQSIKTAYNNMQTENFIKHRQNDSGNDSGNDKVVIIMVLADWCGACKQFKNTGAIEQLKKMIGGHNILMKSDKDQSVMEDLNVSAFPTLCAARVGQNGKLTKLEDAKGRKPADLAKLHQKHATKENFKKHADPRSMPVLPLSPFDECKDITGQKSLATQAALDWRTFRSQDPDPYKPTGGIDDQFVNMLTNYYKDNPDQLGFVNEVCDIYQVPYNCCPKYTYVSDAVKKACSDIKKQKSTVCLDF